MPVSYRTVAAAAALLGACDSAVERVAIVAHYVPACAPASSSTPAQLELIALGDFDRSNVSVSILASNAAAESVGLPPGTRAAELNTLGDNGYWGAGRLDTHNELSILLWPRDRPCQLARRDSAAAASAGSWSLSASERSSQLMLWGPTLEDPLRSSALSVDLSDASPSGPAPGDAPLATRSFASLSELGAGFVLAGGVDPETRVVLQTTELFEPRGTGFALSSAPLSLETPRARHTALALPSGSALLIGGESTSGAALRSVEVLSTTPARFVRSLELLETARLEPQALLLDRDRILVGGGYVWSDGEAGREQRAREPIASVELLSIDLAEPSRPPITLEPAALDRAFVGLGPGGALAVGGCEPRGTAPDCLPCGELGCVSRAVWWIDAEGTPYPLEPLPVELATAAPKLVPGAGGAPWLIAQGRLGRFDPWRGSFAVTDVPGAVGGRSLVAEPRAVGPGLFVWLEADAEAVMLVGFYHSQRGSFTQDVAPLLLGSGDGVVPHRPPSAGTDEQEVILRYTPSVGLELFGAAAVASVADTDYADFTLELSLASGPPPLLRLVAPGGAADDAASFGGLQCPWPDVSSAAPESAGGQLLLRAERVAGSVRLELVSDVAEPALRPPPCQRELPERVGVQLVGTRAGTTRLTRIDLRRSVDEPSAP